jgi:hypothetical protein
MNASYRLFFNTEFRGKKYILAFLGVGGEPFPEEVFGVAIFIG